MLAAAAARRILRPLLPARKKLPFSYWLHRVCGICGPELSHLNEFILSRGTAIDVGANEGLFTYVFSKRFQRVYAFEVNEEVATPIAQYNPGNVTLFTCGLSSVARIARFYIPVIRGFALNGWGSFDRGNLPGAEEFIEKDVQVKPLDDSGITGVDFIKIDVEGHEIEVLKGAAATIRESRPIVLIEVRDENLSPVNAWFLALNFRRYSIEELFNLKEKNENQLYVPAELSNQLRFGS